jgi:hypothetical protein
MQRLESWRGRQREERDDREFPDEVDTPKDFPARIRFQRYRGLQSFRTSPWDPYENLPRDYARIFQFEDFKRTERAVRRRAEEEGGAIPVSLSCTGRPTCIHDTSLRVRLGQELLCISKTSQQKQLSGTPDALLSRSVFCNMNTKNRLFTLPFRGTRNMTIPCAPRLVTVLPLSVSAVGDST